MKDSSFTIAILSQLPKATLTLCLTFGLAPWAQAKKISLEKDTEFRREGSGNFSNTYTLSAGTIIEVPDSIIQDMKINPNIYNHWVTRETTTKREPLLRGIQVISLPNTEGLDAQTIKSKIEMINSAPIFLSIEDYPKISPFLKPVTPTATTVKPSQPSAPPQATPSIDALLGITPAATAPSKPVSPEKPKPVEPVVQKPKPTPVAPVAAAVKPVAPIVQAEEPKEDPQPTPDLALVPKPEPRSEIHLPKGEIYSTLCGCSECGLVKGQGAEIDRALVATVGAREAWLESKNYHDGNTFSAPAPAPPVDGQPTLDYGTPFHAPCDGEIVNMGLHDTWGFQIVYQCEIKGEYYQFYYNHVSRAGMNIQNNPTRSMKKGKILGFVGNRATNLAKGEKYSPNAKDPSAPYRLDHKILKVKKKAIGVATTNASGKVIGFVEPKDTSLVVNYSDGQSFAAHSNVIASLDPSIVYANTASDQIFRVLSDGQVVQDAALVKDLKAGFMAKTCEPSDAIEIEAATEQASEVKTGVQ